MGSKLVEFRVGGLGKSTEGCRDVMELLLALSQDPTLGSGWLLDLNLLSGWGLVSGWVRFGFGSGSVTWCLVSNRREFLSLTDSGVFYSSSSFGGRTTSILGVTVLYCRPSCYDYLIICVIVLLVPSRHIISLKTMACAMKVYYLHICFLPLILLNLVLLLEVLLANLTILTINNRLLKKKV